MRDNSQRDHENLNEGQPNFEVNSILGVHRFLQNDVAEKVGFSGFNSAAKAFMMRRGYFLNGMNPALFNFFYDLHKHAFYLATFENFLVNELNNNKASSKYLLPLSPVVERLVVNFGVADYDLKDHGELLARYLEFLFRSSMAQDDHLTRKEFRTHKINFNRLMRENAVALRLRKEDSQGNQLVSQEPFLGYKFRDEGDNEKVKSQRKKRKRLLWASFIASVLVAIGEGLVAAYFAPAAITAALGLAVTFSVVFVAAAACNYVLFRAATKSAFKELLFDRVFKRKKDGEDVSEIAAFRRAMKVLLGFVVAAGAGFSFLSYAASHSVLSRVFPFLLCAHPIGLVVLSSTLALAGFVSLSSLFYVSAVSDLKDGIFYELYQAAGWSERCSKVREYFLKQWQEDGKFSARKMTLWILKKIIIAALFVFVSISTYGMFVGVSASLFSTWGASAATAKLLATVSAGLSLPVNAYFQWKSVEVSVEVAPRYVYQLVKAVFFLPLTALQVVGSVVSSTYQAIFANHQSSSDSNYQQLPETLKRTSNAISRLESAWTSLKFAILSLGIVGVNGPCQGWGVTAPKEVSLVHRVLPFLSKNLTKWSNFASKTACSNGANLAEAEATLTGWKKQAPARDCDSSTTIKGSLFDNVSGVNGRVISSNNSTTTFRSNSSDNSSDRSLTPGIDLG
jgi:hypothetical protein